MTRLASMKVLVVLLVLNVAGVGFNTFALGRGSDYPVWNAIAWVLGVAAVILLCIAIRNLRRWHSNG